MISIITAVRNGLEVNRIFFDFLTRYTHHPFELIVIDNASDQATRDFFRSRGAKLITNQGNFSYPYTQNQGLEVAKYDWLCFLNNDVIVSPDWDKLLLESMKTNELDIISGCGVENMGDPALTRSYSRKWKRAKNLLSPFGTGTLNLRAMHLLMYGNWEAFCRKISAQNRLRVVEGIVGNNVLMTRRALQLLGKWDERIQGADFDLFMRAKKRSLEVGDIRPCHIALDVFIHHYIRLTVRRFARRIPFEDKGNLIPLADKWSPRELIQLHPDNAVKQIHGLSKTLLP